MHPDMLRSELVELRREAVLDASAWLGRELADDPSWVHVLQADELADLEAAVAGLRGRGLGPFEFTIEEFPLPRFGPVLQGILRELEHGRGLKLLRGLDVGRYQRADLDILYAGIGAHLGRVITQNSRGDRIGEVTDRGSDYASKGVRGHTSNGEIRPHCDTADVVGLLCVESALAGGESRVASATSVYNLMLREHPEFLEPLARGFRINLAGKGPTGRADECSNHAIPVFSWYAGRLSCRYNAKQIRDGAALRGETLTPLQEAAIDYVGDTAMRDGVRLDMDFRAGDIQLLSNHSVLHARGAYRDAADGAQRRLLLRLWVNTPISRPLAPAFADRLNTGPRGEVAVLRPAHA